MYAIQQALRAIRKNWIASVATIATTTLSLTILAGFSLVSVNLNASLRSLQSELLVSAFLIDGADRAELMEAIRSWREVAWVDFISKEDGLAQMQAELPALQPVAGILDSNPLPDRIDVQLLDPGFTPLISQRLRQLPGVGDVLDGSDAVETFLAINAALRVGGSILIVILLSSALFAIVNSIRAAITARQQEIEVMRLVGATRGFIRAPFLIEGFLLGLFSVVITLALVVPGYNFVIQRLAERLAFVPLVRDPAMLGQIAVLLTALSLLVGLVGSAISVSQHLRERY